MTQFIGAPLYFINRDWFYAYMAMTKRSFALTTTVMTQIWGPTTVRISGDESVAGQIKSTGSGGVQFSFPERLVLIANHQVRVSADGAAADMRVPPSLEDVSPLARS